MLGIDYTSYMKSEERWRLQARMIIDERLPWGEEKLEYFKKAFYPDEYIYFWDIYKNRDRVTFPHLPFPFFLNPFLKNGYR